MTKYPDTYWHCSIEIDDSRNRIVNDWRFDQVELIVDSWLSGGSFTVDGMLVRDPSCVVHIQIVRSDLSVRELNEKYLDEKGSRAKQQKYLPFDDGDSQDFTNELLFSKGNRSNQAMTQAPNEQKKYQVFVSSTYIDLKEERNAVYETLLRNDCIPCGMELFEAGNDSQWNVITEAIDLCDYYVLILAHRYGSVDKAGMGYTEKEYRYAIEKEIPVAAMVIDPKAPWPRDAEHEDSGSDKRDRQEKLEAFKKFVSEDKMIRYWKSTGDLQSACFGALNDLIKKHPRSGWIRGTSVLKKEVAQSGSKHANHENEDEEVELAKRDILIGAFKNNSILRLNTNSGTQVQVGGYRYNASELQRLTYIEALDKLEESGFAKRLGEVAYELTRKGLLSGEELDSRGLKQREPK